jgi:LacI family transcriptional regulator
VKNIICINTFPGAANLEARCEGVADSVAEELVERFLRDHPDLVGLFITGGGTSGTLAALRAEGLVKIGYELMDNTRAALVDSAMTLLPFEFYTRENVRGRPR